MNNKKLLRAYLFALAMLMVGLLGSHTLWSDNQLLAEAAEQVQDNASIRAIKPTDNEIIRNKELPFAKTTAVENSLVITDTELPVVDEFVIANGASTTNQITITLEVTATDPTINGKASGVQSIRFLEYEYIHGARRWVPVRITSWIDYDTIGESYPWTLVPAFGMRYMQVWAADHAGNISSIPGTDVINLLPSDETDHVGENGLVFYRVLLSRGETFSANLTPQSGDPDLYVWGSNDDLWYSNAYTGTDTVTFQAPFSATYQIEVHGFTRAQYKLTFDQTRDEQKRGVPPQGGEPKPVPQQPAVPLDEWPDFYNVDPPIEAHTIYLPTVAR